MSSSPQWFARILLLLAAAAGTARAHDVRPGFLQIEESAPDTFQVLWKNPANGAGFTPLEPRISNGLLDVPPARELTAGSFSIRQWRNLHQPRASFDGAKVEIAGLAESATDVLLDVSFLDGQTLQTVLRPKTPSTVIALKGMGKVPVLDYIRLGIEHILTGYDHLAFVLGLVLLIRSLSLLLQTITAFTVAHSITLALAALGHLRLSAPAIESLVALSIVFVAVELLRSWRGETGLTIRRPWLIAFTFGLLHGFAFAGALADIGLPARNIPLALMLFNLGVEVGQLLFVAGLLVIITALRRLPERPRMTLRPVVPYAIGGLSTWWMLQRLYVAVH